MWKGRDVISARDFDKEELEELFEMATSMEKYARSKIDLLKGKIVGIAFFEPSTRTRLSFETAAKRLGADVVGFYGPEGTSVEKGETLAETIRMLDSYADAIVIRHRAEGAAKFAAEVANAPVINAGDGAYNHPTQAMLDLYAIWRIFGHVEGLNIGVMGDLKYARTVNSFLEILANYKTRLYLISPENLRPRAELLDYLASKGVVYKYAELDEVIHELDVLYVVRIQKERYPDPLEYERVKGSYRISIEHLKNAKSSLAILHPLPRVDEIDFEIDRTSHAKYFQQASWGVPLRMALLYLILS